MDRQDIIDIAYQIQSLSGGRVRVAFQEDDKTTHFQYEAAHFLKLDGNRVGRDLELYGFMGAKIMGWNLALAHFLQEVVIPIKEPCPQAYLFAIQKLKYLGEEVYDPGELAEWKKILEM